MGRKPGIRSRVSLIFRPLFGLVLVAGLGFIGLMTFGSDGPFCQRFGAADAEGTLTMFCDVDARPAWKGPRPSPKEVADYIQFSLLGDIANRLAEMGVAIDDDDLWRNREFIASHGLIVETEALDEGDITFEFVTIRAVGRSGPTFVILHDNEDEAFDTAVQAIVQFGGQVVAIENNRHRRIDGIDPNQIFETPEFTMFTEYFEKLFSDQRRVIALHNNTNACNNHKKSICVNNPRENVTAFPAPGSDVDDLIWISAATNVLENEGQRPLIDQLNGRGVNVLYEHVGDYKDHSMSEWAAKSGRAYFNIEAQHYHLHQQAAMLEALLSALEIERLPGSAQTS